MFSIRILWPGLLCAWLAGCGGGGGGDGGGRGSNNDGLSISPTSLTFLHVSGALPPAAQDIAMTVTNSQAAFAGAAYQPGVTPASWLNIQVSGSAPNFVFRFSILPFGLTAGTRTTTVSLGIARADQSIIAYRDVTVTLNVAAMFNVSSSTLTFNHAIGSAATPALAPVSLTGVGGVVNWTASANEPWVTLSATSGTTPATLNVGANPAGMNPGTYNSTITYNGGGIQRTTNVALVVATPAIAPSLGQLSFTGINGATLTPQPVTIALNNSTTSAWTATASAPWVVLSSSAGTTPQALTVSVDPSAGPLASGTHSATIALTSSYAGTALQSSIPVNLTLTPPTLSVDTAAVELGGTDGNDLASKSVQLSLNTGANAFPWSVSGLPTGAQASATSGTVSATPVPLTFQPLTTVVGNTYTASPTFSAVVNGDTVTTQLPMTVRIKPHRLFVHDAGVALLSSATLSKLTQQVTVRENRGLGANWTAVSDQAWLSLTNASGTTGASFQMTADPSSLPAEAISYANVTVSSTSPGVVNTEIVRVGLYKTASSPATQTTAGVPVTQKFAGIAADPVRPLVYVTHGTSTIDAYNIYTGALAFTLTAAMNSDLRALAIDDEGSRLYALDHGTLSVRVADIAAGSPALIANWTSTSWSVCTGCSGTFVFSDLDYTRINGRGVLIGGTYGTIDASTGEVLIDSGTLFFSASAAGSVSGGGAVSFWAGVGTSGHTVSRRTLAFDELADVVSTGTALLASKNGASRGVTTNYDGSTVYHACWHPNELERYDGATLATLSSVSSGTNGGALLGPDGFVYCARYYDNATPDLWAVNATTGALIAGREYNVTDTVKEREFTISGDGLRLLTRSQATVSPASSTLTSTTMVP